VSEGSLSNDQGTSGVGPPSRVPLFAGAAVGVALAAGLAFFFWPASEGRVVFELEPEHAEVSLLREDGALLLARGETALSAVLESGTRRAAISAEGYEPAEVEFEIAGGELQTVTVVLQVAVESVEFAIEPTDAVLKITPATGGDPQALPLEADGRWRGELEVGEYVATVTARGHHDETFEFAVISGEPTLLPVSLKAATRSGGGTVVVPVPGYRGPGYYGPRYYGPGYRGRRR
jgi:hypothetical protein